MEYRFLGSSGLRVSALSLGAWVTYGSQVGEDVAYDCMAAAYEHGVNFLDNAEAYASGEAEVVMGNVIKKAGWKRRLLQVVAALVALAIPTAVFVWYKLFRDVPQPDWITGDPEMNFLYGSIGAEAEAGIPYWIVLVLPRIFDDYLPGPGGYASLGLPWKQGNELPAGFSKKTPAAERWRALTRAKMAELDERIAEAERMKAVLRTLARCRCPSLDHCRRAMRRGAKGAS